MEGRANEGEGKETKILAGSVKDGGIQITFYSDKSKNSWRSSLAVSTAIRSACVHCSDAGARLTDLS